MKILFVNKFFYLKGGSEKVMFAERDFAANSGMDVLDFSMVHSQNLPSPQSDYFLPNIDYDEVSGLVNKIRTAKSMIVSREAVERIRSLVSRYKPDIAHLHNIYHQLTPSIIPALKEMGVRVILSLHDGKLICPAYNMLSKGVICTDCKGRSFFRCVTRNCVDSLSRSFVLSLESYYHKYAGSYDQVDLFLAPSRFLADLCSSRIPKEKIVVLPNGVDLSETRISHEDDGYILYFGRLSREKGVETLLKAHSMLPTRIPLLIAGAGPLELHLRDRYPGVDFLGYKPEQQLKSIIAKASFIVVPSEVNENCSMAILEGMAQGKPVLASHIGGIPEQVEDGVTGLLFRMGSVEDLKEKMLFLWQNPEARKNMGLAARLRSEQLYSFYQHRQTLLQIYRDVLR